MSNALASMHIFSAADGSLASSSQLSMTGTVCSSVAVERYDADIGDEMVVWNESLRGGGAVEISSSNCCCSFAVFTGSSSISSSVSEVTSSSCRTLNLYKVNC